jgi:hypothetical protein
MSWQRVTPVLPESYPRVSMMQAGQDWRGDNVPRSLDGSS